MAGKTPIPVMRAMRTVAQNFDLARRQQRVTVDLLAERANLSVPTVRALLKKHGNSAGPFLPACIHFAPRDRPPQARAATSSRTRAPSTTRRTSLR